MISYCYASQSNRYIGGERLFAILEDTDESGARLAAKIALKREAKAPARKRRRKWL